jgi:hypothetical protein
MTLPCTVLLELRKGSFQTSGQMTLPSTALLSTPSVWEIESRPLQIPFGLLGE